MVQVQQENLLVEGEVIILQVRRNKHNTQQLMRKILIAGPQNVGKTSLINRIARFLNESGFEIRPDAEISGADGYFIPEIETLDFYIVLQRNELIYLCYSWGDDPPRIRTLKRILDELLNKGINVTHLIFSTRDGSEGLYHFTYEYLELDQNDVIEIPMGRMVRGARREESAEWYLNSMFNLVTNFILN